MSLGDTQFCLYVPATAAKKCCSSIPIYTARSPHHRNTSQYSSQRVTTASNYKTATLKLFPTRLEQNFTVLWYQKKRVTSTSSGSQETDQMKKKEKKKERKKTCNNEMQTKKQTGQVNVGASTQSLPHSVSAITPVAVTLSYFGQQFVTLLGVKTQWPLFASPASPHNRADSPLGSFIERRLYAEEGACWHNLPLLASSLLRRAAVRRFRTQNPRQILQEVWTSILFKLHNEALMW